MSTRNAFQLKVTQFHCSDYQQPYKIQDTLLPSIYFKLQNKAGSKVASYTDDHNAWNQHQMNQTVRTVASTNRTRTPL